MTTAHVFTFASIDGKDLPLKSFAGKAVLIVNTASECGYTPQYAGLQKLWQERRGDGLVVLGVPSNDFGAQEPGSEQAIRQFCTARFQVDFPMTVKQTVIGGKAHPFYRWIAEELGEGAALATAGSRRSSPGPAARRTCRACWHRSPRSP